MLTLGCIFVSLHVPFVHYIPMNNKVVESVQALCCVIVNSLELCGPAVSLRNPEKWKLMPLALGAQVPRC